MSKSKLKALQARANKELQKRHLAIVCNMKKTSGLSAVCGHFNMDTEYFSDDEFEQIVSLFNSVGLPITFFTYEDDFFRYVLEKNPSNLIVYNAAQSGTGPGRKSLVPAFCNLHDIPCTGSNAYVVSLCRHKFHVNQILSQAGICTPKTWMYSDGWGINKKPSAQTKVLLKPIYESASIGVEKASIQFYSDSLDQQIRDLSEQYRQPIIAQEFIDGYEVEVPLVCVNDIVIQLPPVGISIDGIYDLQNEILDYERVYFDRYGFYDFASRNPVCAQELCDCASKVASLLGMQGLCRVDFRIKSDNGTHYVTDVSTNPHFVAHSSINKSFHIEGLSSTDIATTVLSAAIIKSVNSKT